MNNKPDQHIQFHREQALAVAVPAQRTWPPANLPRDLTISHKYWLTRGARGISWHRSGRASQGRLQ